MPENGGWGSFVAQNQSAMVLAALGIAFAGLLFGIASWLRARRVQSLMNSLVRGASGDTLQALLTSHLARVDTLAGRTDALEGRQAAVEEQLPACLQAVGLVRFDAFEDVGGEQSFAVAVTDAHRNGVVLSSVFSRSDVRVYAKALERGKSAHQLSEEEQRAVAAARRV